MDNNVVSVYSIPWDLTTTFHSGAANASNQIQSVYHQLDHCHPFSKHQFELNFLPFSNTIVSLQDNYQTKSRHIINKLNHNQTLTTLEAQTLTAINDASREVNKQVYDDCKGLLVDQPIIICGGEHGVGIGYLRALCELYSMIGVIQIDAHMDCRVSYLGYDYSHASVITHYSDLSSVSSITQVGVRDYDATELLFQQESDVEFYTFSDYDMHKVLFEGVPWATICDQIIKTLPKNVFISLDVDGLIPSLCPGTGTPVPGGLTYNQLVYLLDCIHQNNRIIGAELVEVSNDDHSDLGAILGARLLNLLSGCYFSKD